MNLAQDEYGKRTIEFVTRIASAATAEDVRRLTSAELAWYGLEFVTAWSVPEFIEDFADTITMNTRPKSYVDHYDEACLIDKDPVVTVMRSEMVARTWADVRGRRLSKKEREIVDEGRDFGATDGLTIPVLSREGWVGVFSPCGYKPNLSPPARAALEVVGIYAHQALQRFFEKERVVPVKSARLTPREREVMRWVALGKSNDEIGVILGVQRTTIKTMLARALDKLNATSRTFAVVQALRLGELDLNF